MLQSYFNYAFKHYNYCTINKILSIVLVLILLLSLQTKAAYVLVYQRRGIVSSEPKKKGMPAATITSAAYTAGPELSDTNGHAISDDEMDTS